MPDFKVLCSIAIHTGFFKILYNYIVNIGTAISLCRSNLMPVVLNAQFEVRDISVTDESDSNRRLIIHFVEKLSPGSRFIFGKCLY